MKSGNLNFLEPSGPLQACNGTALPYIAMRYHQAGCYKTHVGPTVWGHIAYLKVERDGICSNHFSVNSKRKTKENTKNEAL